MRLDKLMKRRIYLIILVIDTEKPLNFETNSEMKCISKIFFLKMKYLRKVHNFF